MCVIHTVAQSLTFSFQLDFPAVISHFHPHLRHVGPSSRLFFVIFLLDTGADSEGGYSAF